MQHMAIPKCFLTKKRAALLSKTPAGTGILVTQWQMDTGPLPTAHTLEDMTQLVPPLKYLPIASVTN